MKGSLRFLLTLVLLSGLVLAFGCEDNGRKDQNSSTYSSQDYVMVEVRNDYWAYIDVYVGNAFYTTIPPGKSAWVSRNLIGNERLYIAILFYDVYGNVMAWSSQYSFDRDYITYNMDVYSPVDIRTY